MSSVEDVEVVRTDSEGTKKELKWFRDVLSSSYGPWGEMLLFPALQGGPGGVTTLTSHTPKLLQLLQVENPLIQAMISHLQGHAHLYRDSTLYAGMLACNLVLQGLELNIGRRKTAMGICHTLSEVTSWLQGELCGVSHKMTFTSVHQLIKLLTSYLRPKLSMLNQQTLHHLVTLLLRAFLRALPEKEGRSTVSLSDHVYVQCVACTISPFSSSPLVRSFLYEGLLVPLETPSTSLGPLLQGCVRRTPKGTVLTAVFQSSLAGGRPEGSEFSVEGACGVSVDNVVLDELLETGRVLVERGVGLVACQKCVHPALKDYLEVEGVVVLERLSSLLLDPVHQLCGGEVLSAATPLTAGRAQLGCVAGLFKVEFEDKCYCQLRGCRDVHSTLLFCSESQHFMDLLQPLARDAMRVFEWCVGEPVLVCGGGCADTVTAAHLRDQVRPDQVMGCATGGCGEQGVVEMVARCLEWQAAALEKHGGQVLTDSSSQHCWSFPPSYHMTEEWSSCDPAHDFGQSRTCNCGAVLLSALPVDTTWTALGNPEESPCVCPDVCELLKCRVAALSCAAEIAQTLLTTAWVMHQHS